ncbi:flagellar hook-associated protein [Psychromonas sp. CNPT3]|uniref:flagellar hook-associated protein FlgK n=1 Tax=Psychromonas sp. CNPT3 TaxID=314282 RepID=UPI00006E349F|nr:flagellar hook-associated protein FlgK [Psychromonas sp. CNPT3]AGH80575.1 flagellar hook-associated protein [Psychromonas sp. CNPT3]
MADLFQIGLSGIHSSQASLATTGHNIANINTKGYSRQSVEVVTGGADRYGSNFIGRGALVNSIERAYDRFAFTENVMNTSQLAYSKEVFTQTNQIDALLSDSSTSATKPVLEVFKAINGVADHPNMLESRQVFLESSSNMINQYHRLYDNLEIQYNSINHDITNSAKTLTTLAENVAQLNVQIAAVLGSGGDSRSNDLLDERDRAIAKLSEFVDVSVVPVKNGMVNVYVGSGQSIVMGTTSLNIISVNGDPDPSRQELAMNVNGNLVKLDGVRMGGKISALFDVRNNDIEKAFNQLGQNIMGLTHSMNEQQKQGQTLEGKIGGDIFNDINSRQSMKNRVLAHNDDLGSAQLSLRVDDLSLLSADEFTLEVNDYQAATATTAEKIAFTLTNNRTGDTQAVSINDLSKTKRVDLPNTGLSLGIDAIIAADPPQVGKKFSLRPTRLGAQEATLQHQNPEKIAAASAEINVIQKKENNGTAQLRVSALHDPLDPLYMKKDEPLSIVITGNTGGVLTYDIVNKDGNIISLVPGSSNNYVPPKSNGDLLTGLTVTPDLLSGKVTFNIAGIDVEMYQGSPLVGDIFSLNYNETGDGDNSNILEMAALQGKKIMNNNKATFQDIYSGMISEIGSRTANADISMKSATILQQQSFERVENVSGVNMDEEAANLLMFQQHYSAAARVISVAGELFDTILQAVR